MSIYFLHLAYSSNIFVRNFFCSFREGFFKQMAPLQFPSTLGMDFSGVIEKVAEGVSPDLKQGDEVYGQAGVLTGGRCHST
jgi:NADPH:quinone reductase-like Zn-dependent oxidoreductase